MAITIRGNTKISSKVSVGSYVPPSPTPTPTNTPTPTITPTPTPTPLPVGTYSYSVSPDVNACSQSNYVTVYSSSAVLGIGSSLYQDSGLTIPTTYSVISNPNNDGGSYFLLTGNQITSEAGCD